jgi:hypothetical protein
MAGFHHMLFNFASAAAAPLVLSKTLAFFGSTATTAPVYVYEWIPDTGFGTRLADGSNTTTVNGLDVMRINNAGTMLGVVSGSSPFVHVFPITSSGIGTKFSNPGTPPTGSGRNIGFSPDGSAVAVAHATSPAITAYPISPAGFGTKYANPATALPTGTNNSAQWTPAGNEIATSGSTAPRVAVYNWNNGFGTRQTNSFTESSIAMQSGSWNSTGTKFITGGGAAANYGPLVFDHTVGSGFSGGGGPASPIPNTIYAARFNPTDDVMSVAHSGTPFISAYQWNNSSGMGTKYNNPAVLPGNYTTAAPFSVSGTDMIVAVTSNPPGATAYKWSTVSGFGTRYANPATVTGFSTRGGAVQGFYS